MSQKGCRSAGWPLAAGTAAAKASQACTSAGALSPKAAASPIAELLVKGAGGFRAMNENLRSR